MFVACLHEYEFSVHPCMNGWAGGLQFLLLVVY